jgi:hypothetical protein
MRRRDRTDERWMETDARPETRPHGKTGCQCFYAIVMNKCNIFLASPGLGTDRLGGIQVAAALHFREQTRNQKQ